MDQKHPRIAWAYWLGQIQQRSGLSKPPPQPVARLALTVFFARTAGLAYLQVGALRTRTRRRSRGFSRTADGVQKTRALPFRISIHRRADRCIPCRIHRSGPQMVYRPSVEATPRRSPALESGAR